MRYLLFDDENRANLLPLAYTRPIAEFRIGILTIAEKWSRRMPNEAVFGGYVTETYLQGKFHRIFMKISCGLMLRFVQMISL